MDGKLIVGTGISLTENNDGSNETLTIANTLPNVDQNLWSTISSDSGSTTANTTTDTVTIAGGTGITTAIVGDTLTITAAGGGSNAFGVVDGDTGSATANTPSDTISIVGGNKITTSVGGSPDVLTINWGNLALSELTDVVYGSPLPEDNHTLVYESGDWVNVPSVAPPPPGSDLLVQMKWAPIGALSSTSTIPRDATTPLVTEGVQLWSNTITPTSDTSTIRIATSLTWFHTNASRNLAIAIFRGSTCVGVAEDTVADNREGQTVHFVIYDVPAVDTQITYSCRVGKSGGGPGTFYINTHPDFTEIFNGLLQNNAYSIEEIGTV